MTHIERSADLLTTFIPEEFARPTERQISELPYVQPIGEDHRSLRAKIIDRLNGMDDSQVLGCGLVVGGLAINTLGLIVEAVGVDAEKVGATGLGVAAVGGFVTLISGKK